MTRPSILLCAFQSVAVSTGTGESDFEKISAVLAAVPELQYVCVDVANGYSEHFVHFVKDVREKFPSHTIMVSPPFPHRKGAPRRTVLTRTPRFFFMPRLLSVRQETW